MAVKQSLGYKKFKRQKYPDRFYSRAQHKIMQEEKLKAEKAEEEKRLEKERKEEEKKEKKRLEREERKKKLLERIMARRQSCGVYLIYSCDMEYKSIKCSKKIESTWKGLRKRLFFEREKEPKIVEAYRKYNGNLQMEILELCEPEQLKKCKLKHMLEHGLEMAMPLGKTRPVTQKDVDFEE